MCGERVPSGRALFGRVGTLLCGRWRWTSTLRCLWGASRPLWLSGPLRGRPTPSRSPVRSPGHPGLTKALHHPHTPLVLVYYTRTRTFFIYFFCKTSRRCCINLILQNSPFYFLQKTLLEYCRSLTLLTKRLHYKDMIPESLLISSNGKCNVF